MTFSSIPYLDKPVPRIVVGSDFLILQPKDTSFAAYDAYWEAGGRGFDSAHVYGENSNVLGEWLASRGVTKEAVLFDKGCHPYGSPRVTYADMKGDIEQNHERLGVAYTDLFVLHRDDPEVPVGEIVDWLNEFKDQGMIGAFGGSNWHHERIAEANAYAEKTGKQGLSLDNPNLSLASVNEPMWGGAYTIDAAGRRWHEETQFPLFAWSSMARGYFAHVDDADVQRVYDNPANAARRSRAEQMGSARGFTAPQIALAWTLSQPYPVFALAGLRTVDQVRQAIRVLELQLSPEEVSWLESGEAEKGN